MSIYNNNYVGTVNLRYEILLRNLSIDLFNFICELNVVLIKNDEFINFVNRNILYIVNISVISNRLETVSQYNKLYTDMLAIHSQ